MSVKEEKLRPVATIYLNEDDEFVLKENENAAKYERMKGAADVARIAGYLTMCLVGTISESDEMTVDQKIRFSKRVSEEFPKLVEIASLRVELENLCKEELSKAEDIEEDECPVYDDCDGCEKGKSDFCEGCDGCEYGKKDETSIDVTIGENITMDGIKNLVKFLKEVIKND